MCQVVNQLRCLHPQPKGWGFDIGEHDKPQRQKSLVAKVLVQEKVAHLSRISYSHYRIVGLPGGELDTGNNIFVFQVWHFLQNLFKREAASQQIQDISHPNSHASDAGFAAALARRKSNSANRF